MNTHESAQHCSEYVYSLSSGAARRGSRTRLCIHASDFGKIKGNLEREEITSQDTGGLTKDATTLRSPGRRGYRVGVTASGRRRESRQSEIHRSTKKGPGLPESLRPYSKWWMMRQPEFHELDDYTESREKKHQIIH